MSSGLHGGRQAESVKRRSATYMDVLIKAEMMLLLMQVWWFC